MQITTIESNARTAKTGNETQISIIIAVYNAAQYIHQCLLSIREQSFKNIEVILIDGGSTDNTFDIIKEFEDLNIVWKSGPDAGIYDAMNKGARLAQGKWFHFLGSDDRLLSGFSKLAAKIKDPDTVYYGNSKPYYFTEDKPPYEILSGKFSKYRLAKYCINHQAIIYPAKVFKKYSYDLQYIIFADYALNMRVWGDKGFKKRYYPIQIVLYNMNGFSSLNQDELFKRDKPGLVKKSLGLATWLRYRYKKFKNKLKGESE